MIKTPTDLAEFVSSATPHLKLSLNVFQKIFVKILALIANLSHIPRVQKPGLRPTTALAFLYPKPGQKPAQAKSQAQLGLVFFGLAWPGFWLLAGAGTSLAVIEASSTNCTDVLL